MVTAPQPQPTEALSLQKNDEWKILAIFRQKEDGLGIFFLLHHDT